MLRWLGYFYCWLRWGHVVHDLQSFRDGNVYRCCVNCGWFRLKQRGTGNPNGEAPNHPGAITPEQFYRSRFGRRANERTPQT